jgi:hypothetical protein
VSRAGRVVAATAAAFAVLALAIFGPALLRGREAVATTATPEPISDATPIRLAPGQRVCTADITLTPRGAVAGLKLVDEVHGAAPRIAVTVRGPGYAAGPVIAASSGPQGRDLRARLRPAPPRELFGELCAENAGSSATALIGTREARTLSRARTRAEGRETATDLSLTFFEAERRSLLALWPVVVEKLAVLRGFLGHGWLLWPLTLLVVLGVPAAVLSALHRALREDGRAPAGGG